MKKIFFVRLFSSLILSVVSTSLPVKAAEKIYILYGPIDISVNVDSLTLFAESGIINSELKDYFKFLEMNEEQKANFQTLLSRKININPIELSRVLNTPKGEEVLEKLGEVISIPGGRNGKYVLRGAVIQAALEEKNSLNLITVLRYLATDVEIRFQDVVRILK